MLHLLVTCEIFLFNLFLLMEMKHNKNKIIACTILITLLLNDIGLKSLRFARRDTRYTPR